MLAVAERISDLDELLLANVSSTTAVRRHLGAYTFSTYVRREDGGLAPREAEIGFSYTPRGLHFLLHVGDQRIGSGVVSATEDRMVELLRRRNLAVKQSVSPDSSDRVYVETVDNLSVVRIGSVVEEARRFDASGLEYFGDGVYLPTGLIEKLAVPERIQDSLPGDHTPTPSTQGYYAINPRDDPAMKTAKFFANLTLREEFIDGRFVLDGKRYGFQDTLSVGDAQRFTNQHILTLQERRNKIQDAIPELKVHTLRYHPFTVLYALHYPEGKRFTAAAKVMKALFLDQAGLEEMKGGPLKLEGEGILRTSVIEAYTYLHQQVWDYLSAHAYDVPALSGERREAAVKPTNAARVDSSAILQGQTFQSLAILQPDGSYVLPLLLAGKLLPTSLEARLVVGEAARIITREGTVAVVGKSTLPPPDEKNRLVTYRCSADRSTITIESIAPSEVGLDRIVRLASVAIATSLPAAVERTVPAAAALPPAERVEPPAAPRPDARGAISASQYDPSAPPADATIGVAKLTLALGVDSGTFARARDGLLGAKLIYRRPQDQALWAPADAINVIRERLGRPAAVVGSMSSSAEAAPAATGAALLAPHRVDPPEAPDEEYDPRVHVPLGTLVNELVVFSARDREQIHPGIFAKAAREFPRVLRQEDRGRPFPFIRRGDVSDLVSVFEGDDRLTLDALAKAGIAAVYSLPVTTKDEMPSAMTVDLDHLLQDRGVDNRTIAFYQARHHLAQSGVRDKLRLKEGKFLVASTEHRSEVTRVLDAYLAERGLGNNGRGEDERSLGGRAPPPQRDDDGSFYRGCAEALVDQGKVTTGTRSGNFYAHLRSNFGVDAVPEGSALLSYAHELARIRFEEERRTEPLETAVDRLKRELGIGDDDALSIIERTLQVKDTSVPRAALLRHIAKMRFVRDHPYFADRSSS